MEHLRQTIEDFSRPWFQKRALAGLKEIGEPTEGHTDWDYSDSLLLYLSGSDEKYDSIQETDTPYHRLVTAPERAYLEEIADRIVAELPDHFEYIDLGPGTEHKEQFIFDAAKRAGKTFVYRPVDISELYLKLAVAHASEQGIPAEALRSSFEGLVDALGTSSVPRFVSLGLTYSNYDPKELLPLLERIAGPGGTAFINAQIRERTDTKALTEIYMEVAKAMTAEKLKLIGLDPEKDIERYEVTDEVKAWCVLRNSTPTLESMGIRAGDRLLVFQSLRPTRAALEEALSGSFTEEVLFDTDGPFVGAVLKAAG